MSEGDAVSQLLAEVERQLADPDREKIARAIVGATDRERLAQRVVELTERLAGGEPKVLLHASFSLGAVFGWRLADGEEVGLKLHAPGAAEEPKARELRAAYSIMNDLSDAGFACPRLLAPLLEVEDTLAAAMSWHPVEETEPARWQTSAAIRAQAFAELERLASAHARSAEIRATPTLVSPFPAPHSPVFDFDATREAGAAIDAIGTRTAAALRERDDPEVVFHGDFCAHNVRVRDDEVALVLDWDSLERGGRAHGIGAQALASGFDTRRAMDEPPTAAWVEAFLDAYQSAALPLSSDALEAARLSALRTFAYIARCQQSYATANGRAVDEFPFPRELARFERELLL